MPKAMTFAILTRLAELARRACVALSALLYLCMCMSIRVCILRILCTKLRSINFNRISSNWRESSNNACHFHHHHRQHQYQQASALTQSRISITEWSTTYSTLLFLSACATQDASAVRGEMKKSSSNLLRGLHTNFRLHFFIRRHCLAGLSPMDVYTYKLEDTYTIIMSKCMCIEMFL